ncbi:Homeodomain-like protein [Metarhizium rileyi]|uniref:Homeodomain-like protein n=1 Tax=Metarhizium rileyi (strain RCEF 4871) TaxID=1649241 RepID=A0A167AMR3_METRR|nr:Homeodomain-like protein [Metarhizium rileyi RCEF 4871]
MEPITPRSEYSPHKRARIVSAFDSGMTGKEIAEKEGMPLPTVYGIRRRYRDQISARSSPRCGRPPKLSSRDKRRIFQLIRDDPFIMTQDILDQAGLDCSVNTLTRFLIKEGIQHKKALQRPKLTLELASKRLEFARKYLPLRKVKNPHRARSADKGSSTLDPSAHRTLLDASPPRFRFRKLSQSAAAPARLPRLPSWLPPQRPAVAAAAAATTTSTLTPAYSVGEHPPLDQHFPSRLDFLTSTPPNEPDCHSQAEFFHLTSKIELPVLTLPPILPFAPLDETIQALHSSLEVLPGGDVNDIDIPLRTECSTSSDLLPKMPYETVGEPYALSARGHSRGRNGKRSVDLAKPRTGKPPSQKAMLSRALQKANTAVQLDNAQNLQGARESYAEACDLLQHVLSKTTADEDKNKLEAIRRTYAGRIEELDLMVPQQVPNNKELPARPASADNRDEAVAAATTNDTTVVKEQSDVQQQQQQQPQQQLQRQQDTRYLSDSSQETSRSARLNTDQPSLHSTFSRSSRSPAKLQENTTEPSCTPQPLAAHPAKPQHDRYDSEDRGTESHHLGPGSGTRDGGAGHYRNESQNSWLDPIDESGGSTRRTSSMHSGNSSVFRHGHIRSYSGNTEAEFDTALDAAIEAAYDEGYEPMEPIDYDCIDRNDEIVTKALRKVEAARERVRQTEREAYPEEQHQGQEAGKLSKEMSGGFYEDLSSDEEERLLEEMTREYNIEDFIMTEEQSLSTTQPPGDPDDLVNGDWHNEREKKTKVPNTRSLAGTVPRSTTLPSHPVPKSLQPSAPPPQQSLPELPLTRAQSPGQTVRNRRLSGQNPKQLKIQTTQLQPPTAISFENLLQATPTSTPEIPVDRAVVERPQTSQSNQKLTPPSVDATVNEPRMLGSPPRQRGQIDVDEGIATRSGSPTVSKIRKNFSSSSLRSMKSRNMSLSNHDDASDISPGTPSSNFFGSARVPVMPAIPPPLAVSLREQLDSASPGSSYIFEDNIHLPATPGSPNPMVLDPPVALEPCPNDVMLRPFWLMRCLYQTLAHPRGGYLSTKLFVPRDVWKVKGAKIKNVEDKISNCDYLTAALLKLTKVDTCDADAVLDEMQSLEGCLEQVQTALTRKLGNEVGVHGSGVLFKEASHFSEGDGAPPVPRATSMSGKSSSFSWRRLRPKNSNMGLSGAYNSRVSGEGNKEPATMPTLPMTLLPTSRPPKRDLTQSQFIGPNAHYMASLARLFDAAQAIDQIARQVDDPGLRHADKTQVGLELCTRHAAEFFGFYVCRFVLTDLGMLLDKFIKRGMADIEIVTFCASNTNDYGRFFDHGD